MKVVSVLGSEFMVKMYKALRKGLRPVFFRGALCFEALARFVFEALGLCSFGSLRLRAANPRRRFRFLDSLRRAGSAPLRLCDFRKIVVDTGRAA
jgi:hypothetical protein